MGAKTPRLCWDEVVHIQRRSYKQSSPKIKFFTREDEKIEYGTGEVGGG